MGMIFLKLIFYFELSLQKIALFYVLNNILIFLNAS